MGHIFYYIFKIIFSLKQHKESTDNPSVRIYVNKIENKIKFKIKTGYYLEPLTPETMKLLGSNESKVTENKNCENVPYLEITKVVLVHCNIVNNDNQQGSIVLYTFGQLLEISPKNHIFLKTFKLESQATEVWFTDQTSQPLEIEDKVNLTLVIK